MDVHQKMVGVTDLITALAGPREAEEDFNKRHTMSHPPEHIPDMEHIDEKAKPAKEPKKKEEKLKDKVINYMFVFFSHLKGLFSLYCSVSRYMLFMSSVAINEYSCFILPILFW